jgi:Domain of unknown function (DUF4430)
MHRINRARPAAVLLAAGAALALALALALAPSSTHAAPSPSGPARSITVRVEGTTRTLLPATAVALSAKPVVKNGVAADSCSGQSAAGALEIATKGKWTGTWSASYNTYYLTGIEGLAFPSTGADFWAFWVNDAPSSLGICEYHPKAGDSLLFFPDCYGKTCPKSAGVLGIKAAAVATVGKPYTVAVTAYSDAKGTPSPAAGASVSGGGASATTSSGGMARLSFAHAGSFTLKAQKRDAIRTEARVCVQSATAKTCG